MKKLFVFICDSYFYPPDARELSERTGLVRRETFDFAGAGGSSNIMFGDVGERDVDAEHLLIFTGTFHGDIKKAEAYAQEVKTINPNAVIYFRSASDESRNPVFEKSIDKDMDALVEIVNDFIKQAA